MSVSRSKTAHPVDASNLEDWKALMWGALPLDAPPRPMGSTDRAQYWRS